MKGKKDLSLPEPDLAELKKKHKVLLKMCQVRKDDDKLKTALDERQFCLFCAVSKPEIGYYVKLLKLEDWFLERGPEPPDGTEESAKSFLDKCRSVVRKKVLETSEEEIAKTIKDTVLKYGTHFSGKLVNSRASPSSILAKKLKPTQPHLCSRKLLDQGYELLIDQAWFDNSGCFRRIAETINNDSILKEAEVPEHIIKAVSSCARQAIESQRNSINSIKTIDYRLKQVLLPSGETYISVSPLSSSWIHKMLVDGDNAIRKYLEEEAGKEQLHFYTVLNIEIGGRHYQNVSIYPEVHKAILFDVPAVNKDWRLVWSFLYNPLKISIPKKDIDDWINSMPSGWNWDYPGTSLGAIEELSKNKVLGKIVRDQHYKIQNLAEQLALFEMDDGSVVDENLLKETRGNSISPLDLSILRGEFGSSYHEELARGIADYLGSYARDKQEKPIMNKVAIDQVYRAALKILEKMT